MAKDIVPALTKEISPLVANAEKFTIVNEKTMGQAAEFLSTLNLKLDAIEEEREKVTKPLNQALKAENGRWKPLKTTLENAISIVRRKMSVYQTEATRIADAEKAKIAGRVGTGKGKLKAETAINKMQEIDTPANEVAAESGKVQFRTVKKFEVVDFKKLPDNYKVVDEPAIRSAMRNGIVEIPGIRFFEEQEAANIR